MVDRNFLTNEADEDTRRSFLKKGALATAGTVAGAGSAAGQETAGQETSSQETTAQEGSDNGTIFVDDEMFQGLMYSDQIRPLSNFYITSPVLNYTPNVPERLGGPVTEYNMRIITYVATAERVQLFVPNDASFPEYSDYFGYIVDDEGQYPEDEWHPPEVYTFTGEFQPYKDTDKLAQVKFAPLEQSAEEALWDDAGASGPIDTKSEFDDQQF